MSARRVIPRIAAVCLLAGSVLVSIPSTASPATPSSDSYVTVNGAGSTWAAIALTQWQADVARQGIPVNFQPNGSTAGRVYYYQNQVDFAASEIPFQNAYRDSTGTVVTNEQDLAAHRPYAYLPDVAGGTSFMYHLDINGQRYFGLRLSPLTASKIFTLQITNWDDPAIKADNPGLNLPNLPIKAVVRSDGSGTTAQFTAYMASQSPSIWTAFCQKEGVNLNPCPATSLYPPDPALIAQQLSDGVADFVSAPYNNGAITYVEYGYAKQRGFPVASLLNKAGYYTQPTALNVAIALEAARINPDFTQQLGGVYVNPDPRTYPMSSYSYLIVPKSTASPMNPAKGATLGAFITYAVCAGQTKAAELGYSPLPKNLVQFAFEAEALIPGAPKPPPLDPAHCANPTITGAFNLDTAPPPPPGSKQGTPPPAAQGSTPGSNNSTGNNSTSHSSGGTKTSTGKKTTATTVASNGLSGTPTDSGIDPSNGQLLSASGPINLPGQGDPMPLGLYILAGALVLLVVFAPPTVAVAMRSRARNRGSG